MGFQSLVAEWRALEDAAMTASREADAKKQEVLEAMQEAGMTKAETPLGKISLVPSKKTNILVDRDEFERTLKNKDAYDQFVVSKFDMAAVKAYVEEHGDLFGMVEVETTYSPRFTPSKSGGQWLIEREY